MLIRCPECGEQISDQAETCRHCGAPVERAQQGSGKTGKTADPHRVRGIISFCAGAVLLLDILLYVVGRTVIGFLARRASYGFTWRLASAERLLIVCAGGIPMLILACFLSWIVLRAVRFGRARPSTRWTLGFSICLGIITTVVSSWVVWSDSYLPLPVSLFKELTNVFLTQAVPGGLVPVSSLSDNWSLIPVLSAAFLACSLIAAAVRAVYVGLFERH